MNLLCVKKLYLVKEINKREEELIMNDIIIEIKKEENSKKFVLQKLPSNLDELENLDKTYFQQPEFVCAMFVAVMKNFLNDKNETYKMIDYLKGPGEVSTYEKQFLDERMRKPYIIDSYFEGATPDNDYKISYPYVINVIENKYTYISDDVAKFYMKSSGSDNIRPITVRKKISTGEWFLYDEMLLADIRAPKSLDPWS